MEHEAELISPCIDLTNTVKPELSYWYHMYGQNMGSLHVDAYLNGSWVNDITTSKSGNKGFQWINEKVDLSAFKSNVIRIRFRGVTGFSFRSDLALDDIEFIDEPKSDFTYTYLGNGKIKFINNTLNASDWMWTFSNGNTSTEKDPEQMFDLSKSAAEATLVLTYKVWERYA